MTGIGLAPGRFEMVARLVRLFSLGATVSWVVAGIGSARGVVGVGAVATGVAAGTAFHVFADVGNDVCDLPLDRTDPRRARGPLVAGTVTPQRALWLALAMLPVAAAALAASPRAGDATAALAVAVALLAFYNVAGKALPLPVVADIGQGAGWAALLWCGAALGGGAGPASAAGAVYVTAYVAMVNGVHGGLRDVGNDRARGARTTAVLLGAGSRGAGVTVTPPLAAYAAALQIAMWVSLGVAAVAGGFGAAAVVAAALATAWAAVEAVAAYRHRGDLRRAMAHGTRHLALSAAAPAALFSGGLPGWGVAVAVAVFAVPLLAYQRALRRLSFDLPATRGPETERPTPPRRERIRLLWAMTRPGTWMAAALLGAIGARQSGAPWPAAAAVMLPFAGAVAAANIFNDRCDVAADRLTRTERPLVTGALPAVAADRAVLALGAAAFGSAALLGPVAAATTGGALALGLAYSLALRRSVLTGAPVVGLLFASPLVLGPVFAGRPVPVSAWWAAALVLVFVVARELLMGVPDVAGDGAAGYRTVAGVWGPAVACAGFRAGLAVFVAMLLLPVLAGEAGTGYAVAAVLLGAVPATLAVVRLGSGARPAAVAAALHTTGLVFGAGLVPLLLL